jgi:integron integrase
MTDVESQRRRILHAARTVFRRQGKSPRTIKSYLGWIRRFFWFYPDRSPEELGERELTEWLNHLVLEKNVASSTQKQALCAVKALYGQVYREEFPWLDDLVRPKPANVDPPILNWGEIQALCGQVEGVYLLVFYLLFGSGLRLSECLNLRIKDVDLNQRLLFVRGGKGDKDRTTIVAKPAVELLSRHLTDVYQLHQRDLANGAGYVALPHALRRKYPNAPREWRYQWVFPATRIYECKQTGERRRHHLHESAVQRHIKDAVRAAGITTKCTPHTLRHSFAIHLLDKEPDMRKLQQLMGHKDIRTTMIYARLRRELRGGIPSPADDLAPTTLDENDD